MYAHRISTPLGEMIAKSDGSALCGLYFTDQKYFPGTAGDVFLPLDIFTKTENWLDTYFSGNEPNFSLPLSLSGSDFQLAVWEMLRRIPYGHTVTYGFLAKSLGREKMSAQAVGNAVGRNPVSLIVPCHRVLGADGKLRGYAGGLSRKAFLLNCEHIIFN